MLHSPPSYEKMKKLCPDQPVWCIKVLNVSSSIIHRDWKNLSRHQPRSDQMVSDDLLVPHCDDELSPEELPPRRTFWQRRKKVRVRSFAVLIRIDHVEVSQHQIKPRVQLSHEVTKISATPRVREFVSPPWCDLQPIVLTCRHQAYSFKKGSTVIKNLPRGE